MVTAPDEGGSVGELGVGAVDFFGEVYTRHGGPVPQAVLREDWVQRELELMRAAAALVIQDVRRTTDLDPRIEVKLVQDGIPAVTFNGGYGTPALMSIRNPEATCEVADNIRDEVVDELGAAWPVCPQDGLGLDPRVKDGRAVWYCRVGEHIAGDIGDLEMFGETAAGHIQ